MQSTMGAAAIQDWLDTYCGDRAGVTGGIVMLTNPADGGLVIAAEWPKQAAQDGELLAAARAAATDQAPFLQPVHNTGQNAGEAAAATARVISLPVRSGNRAVGSIALELPDDNAESRRTTLLELERVAASLAAALDVAAAPAQLDAASVLRFQAIVLSHGRFSAAATAFATELASSLQFDRVTVGFTQNGYTAVIAISHSAEFESKAEIIRAVGEAMDEAIEQGATIVYPGARGERPQVTLAHAALARRQGGMSCTIPLASNGRIFGAVTLYRATATTLARDELTRCENLVCLVGPVLDLKYSNERSMLRRLRQAVGAAWDYAREPGHVKVKAAVCGATALLAAMLFVPVEYRVSAPARLEGSVQRVLVAPVDGFLRQAHVRPGDTVVADQVLVELAEQDMQLERRKWESELTQHESAYLAALAKADRAQYAINRAKASEARAQLDLVDQQLTRSRVRAPFAGIVIKGDLSQSLGAPVQRGEVLLTIAPADEFRLIVEVDERDIADVQAGQTGQLALAALPNSTLDFRVERVTPVASSKEGRNFFEVEGTFDAAAAKSLRPGLQGVAKIKALDQPLAWIWTHRFVDWLRIALWSWGV
jgi:multidrug resistance efflux pump